MKRSEERSGDEPTHHFFEMKGEDEEIIEKQSAGTECWAALLGIIENIMGKTGSLAPLMTLKVWAKVSRKHS